MNACIQTIQHRVKRISILPQATVSEYVCLISILLSSCGDSLYRKQKANPVIKAIYKETKETDGAIEAKTIYVGWPETFGSLPELKIETIPEDVFPKTTSKDYLTQPNVELAGDCFYLKTDKKQYRYLTLKERGGDTGWSGAELQGYYPALNLYAIAEHSSAEGLGFCNLLLLDRHSSYRYYINSIGDDCVSLPLPSPDGQFMVYYYNWPYEHSHSDLVVLKYNEAAEPEKRFSAYAYLKSETFAIESIVWQDARHFYIRGYEEHLENEKWIRRYSYYEADVP